MRRALVAPLLVALVALGACSSGEDLTRSERARLSRHLGQAPPADATRVDAVFEGGLALVAYALEEREVPAGEPFEVSLYFTARGPLPEGTRAFTHLVDAEGELLVNADDNGLVRALHPPHRFGEGERLRDTLTLPAPTRHLGETWLRVGFFRGDERTRVRLGDGTEDDHVLIPGPRITPSRAPRLPTLRVPRAGAVTIDGSLDEATWASAPRTRTFRRTLSGAEAPTAASARMAWDDEHLYFAVEVEDGDLRSKFTERDDPLWEADVVELFLDPSRTGAHYLELQVSPRGVVFDTHYERRRVPPPTGHAGWDSRMTAAVRLRGTVGDSEPDEGYVVEAKVPLSALAERSSSARPLATGDRWRANFYVIDVRKRGGAAVAWSPPLVADFHYPPRFGTLEFTD